MSQLISDADARRPAELVEVPRVRWLISNTGLRTLQWLDHSGKWLSVPEVEAKDAESSP